MKLHDNTIAHIAKIVQIAILTGTDVTDHLRMMILKEEEEFLRLDVEYEKIFEDQIKKMVSNSQQHLSNQE